MDTREIPLMGVDDIDVRVRTVYRARNGQVGAVLLLYITARAAMNALDTAYGVSGWQRTHEIVGGELYCNIDIWDTEKNVWVRKQDVGVESNAEKEKGRASDSFKRAAVNAGVGRELYSAPLIHVWLADNEYYVSNKNGKDVYACAAGVRFLCAHIAYDEQHKINQIVIVDGSGKPRFRYDGTIRP